MMSTEQSRTKTPSWLNALLNRYRNHVIMALILGLIAFSCGALLMFVSGFLISRTAQPGVTLFLITVPVAFVQIFGIGRPIARYFERLISHDWVFRITSDLRLKMFKAVEASSGNPLTARSTGEYLGVLTDDIGHLQNLYLRVAFPITIALLLYLAAIVFCAFFSSSLALVMAIVGAIAAIALPLLALAMTKNLNVATKADRAAEYQQATDNIMGATDLSLAGRSEQAAQLHEATSAQLARKDQALRRRLRIIELLSSIVLGLGICFVLAIATQAFADNYMDVNLVAAFTLGFFPLIEVFILLPGALADSTSHSEALRRIDALFSDNSSDEDADSSKAQAQSLDAAGLSLSDMSYTYPGASTPALKDVSLTIPAGQSLAILGKSGAGKSTLAALIRGALQAQEGSISLLSDASSSDGNAAQSIQSSLSYIPQNPYIFSRTLRANLKMARPDATDEELIEALKRVGLQSKFESLDKGLNTRVGETGVGFSGGETHRIALARALVAQTPIIILDEPFSALDPHTEHELLDTLFDVFSNKTLIVITHHLAGIEKFDRVIFVEDGSINLDGVPSQLAQSDAYFKNLLEFDRPSSLS